MNENVKKELEDKIAELQELVFQQAQRIQSLEDQTELTPDEILQRKDLWTKEETVNYLKISTKTFERWKADDQIPVITIGGSDYVRKYDLKNRFGADYPNQDFI